MRADQGDQEPTDTRHGHASPVADASIGERAPSTACVRAAQRQEKAHKDHAKHKQGATQEQEHQGVTQEQEHQGVTQEQEHHGVTQEQGSKHFSPRAGQGAPEQSLKNKINLRLCQMQTAQGRNKAPLITTRWFSV